MTVPIGQFNAKLVCMMVMAWWLVGTPVICGQPTAPSLLTATNISSFQINLGWKDNSANEQGFRIEQSLDSILFFQIAQVSTNAATYSATNLNPGIKFYFRMRSFNGSGNSAYSNTNSATTFTPWVQWQRQVFTSTQLTNPVVSGLTADPDGDGAVNLVEYAFNQQPFVPDNTNAPFTGIDTNISDGSLSLRYTRNAAAIDVAFNADVSTNLVTWFSGRNVVTGPVPISTNGSLLTEKFHAMVPLAASPQQFMRLGISYNGVPDSWITGPAMPAAATEMSCAWLGDKLYVSGEADAFSPTTSSPFYVYNFTSNSWSLLNPDRPYKGTHHAVEVFGNRMYLIGGFDGNSSGKVQIYDATTNGWSVGATAPYLAGSCASALINGKIYIAGGIVGVVAGSNNGVPTNAAAVYDIASNIWTMLPPMDFTSSNGMNHAASATDGSKFFIFGGRDDDHRPDIGYNSIQIYDPASNTWSSSADINSTLTPMPQPRGGMGKAVFYNGDFYVMGGETVSGGTGAIPANVYNRVDIYNLASNTWRTGTPMPTARHGIFPALRGNRIYVVGGGGASPFPTSPAYTSVFEIYITP